MRGHVTTYILEQFHYLIQFGYLCGERKNRLALESFSSQGFLKGDKNKLAGCHWAAAAPAPKLPGGSRPFSSWASLGIFILPVLCFFITITLLSSQ